MSSEIHKLFNDPNVISVEVGIDNDTGEAIFEPTYRTNPGYTQEQQATKKSSLYSQPAEQNPPTSLFDHTQTAMPFVTSTEQTYDQFDAAYQPPQPAASINRYGLAKYALVLTAVASTSVYATDAISTYSREGVVISPVEAYDDVVNIPSLIPKVIGMITKKEINDSINGITG